MSDDVERAVTEAQAASANELADKLQRFIDMPEWQRFYMDKEQAAECVAALKVQTGERHG